MDVNERIARAFSLAAALAECLADALEALP